jgi:hypothetical protein
MERYVWSRLEYLTTLTLTYRINWEGNHRDRKLQSTLSSPSPHSDGERLPCFRVTRSDPHKPAGRQIRRHEVQPPQSERFYLHRAETLVAILRNCDGTIRAHTCAGTSSCGASKLVDICRQLHHLIYLSASPDGVNYCGRRPRKSCGMSACH